MFDFMFDFIESHMAISIVIGIILLIISFSVVKKYFKWIETSTGYNPINGINIVLCALIIIAPYISNRFSEGEKLSILTIASFIIPIVILIIRNLKIKNPLHIILVSIIHVLLGVVIAVAVVLFIALAMLGIAPKTKNNLQNSNENEEYLSPAAQSWMGHEYEIDVAQKLGFNSVEEAIDAGFSYDGRRI